MKVTNLHAAALAALLAIVPPAIGTASASLLGERMEIRHVAERVTYNTANATVVVGPIDRMVGVGGTRFEGPVVSYYVNPEPNSIILQMGYFLDGVTPLGYGPLFNGTCCYDGVPEFFNGLLVSLPDLVAHGSRIVGMTVDFLPGSLRWSFTDDTVSLDLEGLGFRSMQEITATLIFERVAVPEPLSLALFSAGLMGLTFARRRSARRATPRA